VYLQITTKAGLAWLVAITFGSLFGSLVAALICLGIDIIITKRGNVL